MIRRRLNSRLELNAANPLHAKSIGKINPFRMVLDEFYAAQRRRHFFPASNPIVQFRDIGFQIFFKSLLMLGKVTRKTGGDVLSDDFRPHRIQQIMGIALGMKVSFRAVHERGGAPARVRQRSNLYNLVGPKEF